MRWKSLKAILRAGVCQRPLMLAPGSAMLATVEIARGVKGTGG